MKKLNCGNIVKLYLKENNYDGLHNDDIGCSCDIDDLFICGFSFENCKFGYKNNIIQDDEDNQKDYIDSVVEKY